MRAHEDYDGEHGRSDIALISLNYPVTGIQPVALAGSNQPIPDKGALAVISGYGAHGTGSNPPVGVPEDYDDKRRIAMTNIVGYGSVLGMPVPLLLAQFRNPLSPGDPDYFGLNKAGIPVPSLQGSPAPGDSGGPLFLVTENGLVQIGTVVGTPGSPVTGTAIPGYGIIDDWTPVPLFVDWIQANNALRQVSSRAGDFAWSDSSGWFDLVSNESVTPNNRDGAFTGIGTLGRYYQVELAAPGTVTLDMNPVIDDLHIDHPEATLDIGASNGLTVLSVAGLSEGRLNVDGTLNTGFLSLTGGALTGGGRIASWYGVLNTGAVVAPNGTLTINGSYHRTGAGVLSVRLAGNASDRLVVSDTAILGGTLQLVAQQGPVMLDEPYTVLQSGTIVGRFDTVVKGFSSAFLDASVAYGGNAVTATVSRNDVGFSNVALAADDKHVASRVEGFGLAHPIGAAILHLDAPSARNAFGILSGEGHASAVTVGYGDARLVQGSILTRLRRPWAAGALLPSQTVLSAFATDRPDLAPQAAPLAIPTFDPRRFALWGEGFGSWGRVRSSHDTGTLDTSTGGFILGAEANLNGAYRFGIAGGFTRTSFDLESRLSSGSNESVFGALYGAMEWGALNLRLGASYAHQDIAVSRQVVFPGFADGAGASYDGSALQAFGELGYRFDFARVQVEPFIGASALRLHTGSFVENGGTAALIGYGQTHDLATTTLGVRAQARVSDETPLILKGMLGWRQAYGDVNPEALLAFAAGGSPFAVSGAPVDRSALVAEAGLDWQATPDITLGISYNGQIGTRAQDHALKGNFTWRF